MHFVVNVFCYVHFVSFVLFLFFIKVLFIFQFWPSVQISWTGLTFSPGVLTSSCCNVQLELKLSAAVWFVFVIYCLLLTVILSLNVCLKEKLWFVDAGVKDKVQQRELFTLKS